MEGRGVGCSRAEPAGGPGASRGAPPQPGALALRDSMWGSRLVSGGHPGPQGCCSAPEAQGVCWHLPCRSHPAASPPFGICASFDMRVSSPLLRVMGSGNSALPPCLEEVFPKLLSEWGDISPTFLSSVIIPIT